MNYDDSDRYADYASVFVVKIVVLAVTYYDDWVSLATLLELRLGHLQRQSSNIHSNVHGYPPERWPFNAIPQNVPHFEHFKHETRRGPAALPRQPRRRLVGCMP